MDCILCPIYRPDATPRTPERPPVCTPHRYRLDSDLADLADMHHRLTNPDRPDVDDRWYQHHDRQGTAHWRRADPLASIGGSAPVPGRTKQPTVAGSREPATPTNLGHVDLAAPARQPEPSAQGRRWPQDHTGHLSTATLLDQWVRDWRDSLFPDHQMPDATVHDLTAWLRAGATTEHIGHRLDRACDRHPAIADMAAEIRDMRYGLRRALGETDPKPETIDGVRCPHCKLINVLERTPADVYHAECKNCGALYTPSEYQDLVTALAAKELQRDTPALTT